MDDVEDTDTATAMAAAMGFSSFGAQKPNKRRKFNPSTDAFVASDSPSNSTSTSTLPFHRYNDNDGDNIAITGSNTVPLGVRKQNVDEIDLDGDQDEAHPAPDGQAAQPITTEDDEDPEPQYLDTSRPSAPIAVDSADALQSRIDAIVGSSAYAPTSSQLPPRPSFSSTIASDGHSSRDRGGHQHNMTREGQSGTRWWEGYYDPAFIINPWDSLEKSNGLEPRGDWVSWEEAKTAQT
ncbi:hypothetical protein ANO14919_042260 [Xylariales sp. No.14919]|nr:hypothetical protein F5X98DRAFT_379653 [Xylaria grammica]GAW14823.1 hypothetical protein ANO14919_042260 [Xylariales sp. No.14919]